MNTRNEAMPRNCLAFGLLTLLLLAGCSSSWQGAMPWAKWGNDSLELESASQPSGKQLPWETDWDAALRRSQRTGKPILACFTGSDWCPPCKRLKQNVFGAAEFHDWAEAHVVLLELDFPRYSAQDPELARQNRALADEYNIQAYPTTVLLAPDGSELGRMGSGTRAVPWIEMANAKLGSAASTVASRPDEESGRPF